MRPFAKISRLFIALTVATIAAPLHSLADEEAGARKIDVAPQPLSSALQDFSEQSGLQVAYVATLAENVTSKGAHDAATPAAALSEILDSTGLEYQFVNDSTVAIGPAVAAYDEAEDPGNSWTTPGPVLMPQAQTPAEQSQTSRRTETDSDTGEQKRPLEEIIVTGSRLRSTIDGPSPVIIMNQDDIRRTGATTISEALVLLPQNVSGSEVNLGGGSFLGATTVRLRGIANGATLVLLNGRPVSASGEQYTANVFDLNTIPLAAVERIEVLTDTASAIYGADALGGAVNFVLKREYQGAAVSVRYGTSQEGDGTERQATLTFGGSGGRFSGVLVMDVVDRDPVLPENRELSRSQDFRRFGGSDLRNRFSYPANVYSLDGQPLPGLSSTFAGTPHGTDGIGLTPADFVETDGVLNMASDGFAPTPKTMRQGVLATGAYDITDSVQLYSELLYTRIGQTVFLQQPTPLFFGGAAGLFRVPADNPFNPFDVEIGVDYRSLEIEGLRRDSTTDFSRFVVGANGSLGAWTWDAWAMQDRNDTFVVVFNNVDRSIAQQFLDSTDPNVALNVFSTTGNNNPMTLSAITFDEQKRLLNSKRMFEATLRRAVVDLPGGSVQLAAGANLNRNSVDLNLLNTTEQIKESQDARSVFAELIVPIVGPENARPGLFTLEASAAVRYDDYPDTDFGSVTNPQYGLMWRPHRDLLVRGSFGRAFRLPSLFQRFSEARESSQFRNDPRRGGEETTFIQVFGGNPNLDPETARSRTLGFVWEPQFMSGFSLEATGFWLQQDDSISSLSLDVILQNENLFPDRVVRADPTPNDIAQGFAGRLLLVDGSTVNFGRLDTSGVDVRLSYDFSLSSVDRLTWTAAATYVTRYDVVLAPGAAPQDRLGQADFTPNPLRWQGVSQLAWSRQGGLSASLTARAKSGYRDFVAFNFNDGRDISSAVFWDAQVRYRPFVSGSRALANTEFSLGAVNLANEQGPFSNNSLGFDPTYGDIRGRYLYITITKEFL